MKPKLLWLIVALSSIWLAVILISLLAPDSESGFGQWRQSFPIAAATTWFFGVIATIALVKDIVRRRATKQVYMGISIITTIFWLVAIPVSILTPPLVSGTDPSIFPLAAIIAPLVAAVITMIAGNVLRMIKKVDWSDEGVNEDA